MTKKIKKAYFPKGLKFTSPLFFIVGVYLIIKEHPFYGVPIILAGTIILTTFYVTVINLSNRSYKDYLFLLGFKLNKESQKFRTLDRIIITKGTYSRILSSRIKSPTVMKWAEYTALLLFDQNNKLELLTKNDKGELIIEIIEFAKFLNVKIEDRTTQNFYWINLERK